MNESWIHHPNLADIDTDKLTLLMNLANAGNGKSPSEILPFLLSILKSGQKNRLHFSDHEIAQILDVLKKGKTPAEISRIEKIISLTRNVRI